MDEVRFRPLIPPTIILNVAKLAYFLWTTFITFIYYYIMIYILYYIFYYVYLCITNEIKAGLPHLVALSLLAEQGA